MAPQDETTRDPVGRRTPAKGVFLAANMPLILWCTVCTRDRIPWVTQASVMEALEDIWLDPNHTWWVGEFLLMPDHVHFFSSPRRWEGNLSVEQWTGFWKDRFAKITRQPDWRWQAGLFHTRLRSDAHYHEKRDYMHQNPVRAGLAARAEDWPWRGRIHDLEAHLQSFGKPPPKSV